jgi:hypothetical protein
MSNVVDSGAARLIEVVTKLLVNAQDSVERAAVDQVAADDLCDKLETISNLVHAHAHPKPRSFVDAMAYIREVNE